MSEYVRVLNAKDIVATFAKVLAWDLVHWRSIATFYVNVRRLWGVGFFVLGHGLMCWGEDGGTNKMKARFELEENVAHGSE